MRTLIWFFTLVIVLASTSLAETTTEVFQKITWLPQNVSSGSPCLFKVTLGAAATSVTGQWQNHPMTFASTDDRREWYALAGIDVEAKPGTYKLEISATLPDGQVKHGERDVAVSQANYKTEVLRVPQKFVKPSPEAMVQIEADRETKKAVFSHGIPVAEWSGRFNVPVGTKPSEGFGTRRIFNGQLASIHRGMDYHAASGTPILAANSGQVVLARKLYYEGNCVIINHGQQFMTIYMHLSQFKVKEGDKVEKGQEIGLSGATGRVTGPHLHIAVRWQDAYLDPAQLWELPLPVLIPLNQPTQGKQ